MSRLSFRVIDGGRHDPAPCDDNTAGRGIAFGMALTVPCWLAIGGVIWWAWATGVCK